MDRTLYFDGQDVLLEDLQNTVSTKASAIKQMMSVMALQHGVITGLVVSAPSAFRLSVTAGVAYDPDGERVETTSTTTVLFNVDSTNSYVVVRYVPVQTGQLAHPVIGSLYDTQQEDSYEFEVVTTVGDNDIVLATITDVDSDGIATLSTEDRNVWSAQLGLQGLSDDALNVGGDVRNHINATGSGSGATTANPHNQAPEDLTGFELDARIEEHRKLDHGDLLQTADSDSLSGKVLNQYSGVYITPIVSGDSFVVDGTVVTSISTLTLGFILGNPRLVELVLSSTGVVSERSLLQYTTAARSINGVQPVNVNYPTFPLTPTTDLDYVVSGSVRTLQFGDGPAVILEPPNDVFNGDRFYTLVTGDEAVELTVWVDYSSLPGTSQTDYITIISKPEADATKASLALLYLNNTLPIGYGDEGTRQQILDTRNFGSVRYDHFSEDVKEHIRRLIYELRSDGWSVGGDYSSPGGREVHVGAGVVYVKGERYVVGETILTVPANDRSWIYVNESGTVVQSTSDPAQALGAADRYARSYRVDTNATVVTFVQDERKNLTNENDQLRLGVEALYSETMQLKPRETAHQGRHGSMMNRHRGRTLWRETTGPAGYYKVRTYLTFWSFNPGLSKREPITRVAGFEITVNAKWVPHLTDTVKDVWIPDNSDNDASVYGFDGSGVYFQIKRKEDYSFEGNIASWKDTVMDGPSWSSVGLQTDMRTNRTFLRTQTKINESRGLFKGQGNDHFTKPRVNVLSPNNLVKAWGMFELRHVDPGGGAAPVKVPNVHLGLNLGRPVYIGDGTDNRWKIPLKSRLLRIPAGKDTVLPDGAVVGMSHQTAAVGNLPKLYLFDDGRATYVMVQGPVNAGPPVTEYSFSCSFIVLGSQITEPLPEEDPLVFQGGSGEIPMIRLPDWARNIGASGNNPSVQYVRVNPTGGEATQPQDPTENTGDYDPRPQFPPPGSTTASEDSVGTIEFPSSNSRATITRRVLKANPKDPDVY